MSRYTVEYDPRTEPELGRLPLTIRRRIVTQLEFLRASPYRSHPGVKVKPTLGAEGVWHFHASQDVRVYYLTEGSVLWVVMVEQSAGVTRKSVRRVQTRA